MRPFVLLLVVLASACGGMVMPKAPMLMKVEKMDGALMVTWMNTEKSCDAIEGERKSSAEAYKRVFSVAGEVDRMHDTSATADTTYTYQLRCKKAGMYSDYSSEVGANPLK